VGHSPSIADRPGVVSATIATDDQRQRRQHRADHLVARAVREPTDPRRKRAEDHTFGEACEAWQEYALDVDAAGVLLWPLPWCFDQGQSATRACAGPRDRGVL
jgi:hypothetical protein